MRRYRLAAALLLAGFTAAAVAGCSSSAPPPTTADVARTAPLDVGSECLFILPDRPAESVPFTASDGEFYAIEAGTKCRVLDDPFTGRVSVTLLEGPHRGTAGKASRSHLRPVGAD